MATGKSIFAFQVLLQYQSGYYRRELRVIASFLQYFFLIPSVIVNNLNNSTTQTTNNTSLAKIKPEVLFFSDFVVEKIISKIKIILIKNIKKITSKT